MTTEGLLFAVGVAASVWAALVTTAHLSARRLAHHKAENARDAAAAAAVSRAGSHLVAGIAVLGERYLRAAARPTVNTNGLREKEKFEG